MACGTINNRRIRDVFAVMNENGPDLNENEEPEVSGFLEREHERKQVIGRALEEAVNRMEGHGGVRGRHDPLVVGLVKRFIHIWVVQAAMYGVHQAISEEQEERELENIVPQAGSVRRGVV
jgi:hypothetical protein